MLKTYSTSIGDVLVDESRTGNYEHDQDHDATRGIVKVDQNGQPEHPNIEPQKSKGIERPIKSMV